MTALEYMERWAKLNNMIKNKMVEKEQWNDIASGITAYSESERVQSSGSQQKMADALAYCIDLQREIDQLKAEKDTIDRTVEMLSATEYDVLHKRYIQDLKFYEIGVSKKKSESWAKVTHNRALRNLQAILDERERAIVERSLQILSRFENM